MLINRIRIQHFRSIKHLEFFPSNICALVGHNNAGKTNILSALNFLLGEIYPSKRGVEPSDYYQQDLSKPIHIEVGFAQNPHNVRAMWCTIPGNNDRPEVKVLYNREEPYNASNEVRDRCALVYLDANRNLDHHLGHSKWTLFGRILRQLDVDFRANASEEQLSELDRYFNDTLILLKTKLYVDFEETIKSAFDEQIRQTSHKLSIEFRTFDPLNYYRSIRPLLIEGGLQKNPTESGQGMRNLILLALFRTYAKVFRGDAIVAIEEPEIYLHPHAQRSLASLFVDLAQSNNQIFYSTHSSNFVDIERFDDICLVEKCLDEDGNMCTQVRQVSAEELLDRRKTVYPNIQMNELSLKERLRNVCDLEHNEAFFAQKIVLVEGDTEEYVLPIFARFLGYDFNDNGVSIVNARGKLNLDQLYDLYQSFGIPTYLIFDNDKGGQDRELRQNEILLNMLGYQPEREPDGVITDTFAILEGNFENQLKLFLNSDEANAYEILKNEASQRLGSNLGKGLIGRYMALKLIRENIVPPFIAEIIAGISSLGQSTDESESIAPLDADDEDLPF
jgi:putative ATP-dependent endonuclease of the OLD family